MWKVYNFRIFYNKKCDKRLTYREDSVIIKTSEMDKRILRETDVGTTSISKPIWSGFVYPEGKPRGTFIPFIPSVPLPY